MSSQDVGLIYALSTMFILIISFSLTWYHAIKMARNRKPGVPFSEGAQSPYNIVFRPHQLTTEGLSARKKVIFWVSILLGTLLLSCIVVPGLATLID